MSPTTCESPLELEPRSDSPTLDDPSLPEGFKWIDGRGFKIEGNPAYMLPSDNPEVLRLHSQHRQLK
ncbi:hypothetical protein BC938DRAFT_483201 [Jimgerdemannia flammicorona]|uniref:Uncharacterized protein n=1 Tax=Jimgerdemannia flammicorona TaxID=994334 RepID=A0A433QCI6_9FUNG|nr:hypothetical protein BC938DRAFT_483201 [Jimgerdemannia flammicorona]